MSSASCVRRNYGEGDEDPKDGSPKKGEKSKKITTKKEEKRTEERSSGNSDRFQLSETLILVDEESEKRSTNVHRSTSVSN